MVFDKAEIAGYSLPQMVKYLFFLGVNLGGFMQETTLFVPSS